MTRLIGLRIATAARTLLILAGLLVVSAAVPNVAHATAGPEIDPGSVGNAVALLTGGLLVLGGLRRKSGPQGE